MAPQPGSPLPLYHRVYLVLRQKLLEGEFAPDAMLPTEQELGEQFKVSRITVRRALEELESEGLISRQRGRGTFATGKGSPPPDDAEISGLLENLVAMGLKTQVEVVDFDYVPAPPDVQAALRLAPGALVQRSVRLRSFRGQRFSHLTAFVPEAIGRTYGRRQLKARPLLGLLEAAGARAHSAEQTISATLADGEVAALLGVQVASPLLSIRRLVRAADGQPIELIRSLYRPDRCQYRTVAQRDEDRDGVVWRPDFGAAGD